MKALHATALAFGRLSTPMCCNTKHASELILSM